VVRVKVCGITSVDDALACVRAGVDWIGLNFYPGSPRCVHTAAAAEIVGALPATVAAVGVFVDRPVTELIEIAERVGLAIVQLHGCEPPEDLVALDRFQIVRAFRLDRTRRGDQIDEYMARARTLGRVPDAVLVDAHRPNQPGGTGVTIPDEALASMPGLPRLILAGGLTPENVAERVERVRPWMVDVASGVESMPGRKDFARISDFVQAARGNLLIPRAGE
jgi:phosphoribosylanthranilate isomerase